MSWLSHQKGRGNLSPKLLSFPQDGPSYKGEMREQPMPGLLPMQGGIVAAKQPCWEPLATLRAPAWDWEENPGVHVHDPNMRKSS